MRIKILLISTFVLFTIYLISSYIGFGKIFEKIGLKETEKEETITLNYWGTLFPKEVMNEVISDYQAKNPQVKIIYTENTAENVSEYRTKLFARLYKDKKTEEEKKALPSIFEIHSTWVADLITKISLENEAITQKEFDSRFYKIALDQNVSTSGRVVAVPLNYDGLVLLYNTQDFKDAGIGEINTWEDLKTAAIKLTVPSTKTSQGHAGVALGTTTNIANYTDVLGLMLKQNQVQIPDRLNGQAALEVFRNYIAYNTVYKTWNAGFTSSIADFAAENVSMIFIKASDIPKVLKINPSLKFEVLAPPQLPLLEGGVTKVGYASYYSATVYQDLSSKQQKVAWDYLNWLTQKEQQIKLNDLMIKYNRFPHMYSNKEINSRYSTSEYKKYFEPALKYATQSASNEFAGGVGNIAYEKLLKTVVDELSQSSAANDKDGLEILNEFKTNFLKLKKNK